MSRVELAEWLERAFGAEWPAMRPEDWLVMAKGALRYIEDRKGIEPRYDPPPKGEP